jgi:hypothetical protein
MALDDVRQAQRWRLPGLVKVAASVICSDVGLETETLVSSLEQWLG